VRFAGWIATVLVALALFAPSPGWAQAEEYGLQKVQFELFDEDGRAYAFRPGEASLKVRLLGKEQNPALEGLQTLEAEETSYEVDGAERSVEITGNVALVPFVVFRDPAREKLFYHVSMFVEGDGGRSVSFVEGDDVYGAGPLPEDGAAAAPQVRQSTERAPQVWEYATLAAIGLVGLLFAYLVFGRALFRKMLFGAKMPVTAALTISNLLLLAAVLALLLAVALAWFFPIVTGGMVLGYEVPYLGYVSAAVIYLAVVCLAWLAGHLAWR